MKRTYLFHFFFLGVFLFLLIEFARLMEPFLTPVLGAIVLFILAYPLHRTLSRFMPRRSTSFHAALSTLIVTTLIVGPFVMICWLLFSESQSMAPLLQQWGTSLQRFGQGTSLMNFPLIHFIQTHAGRTFGLGRLDFEHWILDWGGQLFNSVGEFGKTVATNTILSVGYLAIMLFTLFFLFRDGESFFAQIRQLIPMRAHDKDRLVEKLHSTVTQIIRGSILTAIFQMISATIGYAMAGVPAAVTLGVVTGVASFIPAVGTALVWLPMGLFLLAQGAYGRGIFILAWGIIVITTLDNLLRTFFIGRKTSLPTLFLFFGILGGAELYGLNGLLIGPLLVAIIPVFVDIYRDQYLRTERPGPSGKVEDAV